MKLSYSSLVIKYNQRLLESGVSLRILSWVVGQLTLSTGEILNTPQIKLFRSRVASTMLRPFMDQVYNAPEEKRLTIVKDIKSAYASATNREWWLNLDDSAKDIKIKHMRSIQRLVDQAKIQRCEPWNKGKTKHNDVRLAKNSVDRSHSGNPMYGTKMSEEQKKIKSDWVKDRICRGVWTPHVHNSRTRWNCSYKGKKYRSSWEAIYAALNPTDAYEEVRVRYRVGTADEKVYIVDFCNHQTNVLTEIKPKVHTESEVFVAKAAAAQAWCEENGYTFRVLTEQYFVDAFDEIPFDEITIPNLREKIARIRSEACKQN